MDCTKLTPDGQAAEFLKVLFAPGDCVLFRPIETLTENGKKKSRVDYKGIVYRHLGVNGDGGWQHLDASIEIMMRPMVQRSAAEHTNVFYGVCPRFRQSGGGKVSFDAAWQIRTIRVLWADIDHVTVDEARERIKVAGLPEPSIVVNSGNGVHVYWLLDEPYIVDDCGDPKPVYVEFIDQGEGKKKKPRKYRLDGDEKLWLDIPSNVPPLSPKAELVQDVLTGIASKIDADHTTDLARLLRVAGTMNRKDERNGKQPIPCTLVVCEPNRRYPFDLFVPLAEASPDRLHREKLAKVKLPTPRKLSPTKRDKYSGFLAACNMAEVGQRSQADFGLCCFAIKSGMAKTEVWADVHNVGKFAEGGDRYFGLTWAAAETKVREEIAQSAAASTSRERTLGDGDGDKKKSQATVLVDLALDCGAELWHSTTGDAYATLPVEQHREHWPIKAKGFRRWLARQYHLATEGAVGSEALQAAMNVLEGKALFDGVEYPVCVRTAEFEGSIYLDLCDAAWRAVECSPQGWRVVENPPVRFRRAKAMLALPEPVRGGHVDGLREYVNVHDDSWPLLVAWLLAAYRPRGPYPALNLHGEQGSAKSTTAKALRSLVDPNTAPLRCEPREPRDLAIAANNGWVVALDNLSRLPPWLSDALCRLSTGGGFATRELFSDQDEVIFDAMRPLVITGIEEVATRSDLLDRSIMVSLPTIPEHKRRPESEFWVGFHKSLPALFGAMLTAVCEAVANVNKVVLTQLPRMADFALWSVAGERAMGLHSGEFMDAYTANRAAGNEVALEASPVATAVITFMSALVLGKWTGTATALMDVLDGKVSEKTRESKAWPRSPRGLSGILKRLAPNLRQTGIEVEFCREPDHDRRRVIVLARTKVESCVRTVQTVRTEAESKENEGNGRTQTSDGRTQMSDASPVSRTQKDVSDASDAKFPLWSNPVDDEVEVWTE
jgi:hypothetical protein